MIQITPKIECGSLLGHSASSLADQVPSFGALKPAVLKCHKFRKY